jgi:hypothetical protein
MPLAVITIILSIVFSLLSYTNRTKGFFLVGSIFCGLSGLLLVLKLNLVIFYVELGDFITIALLCAWLGSIVFLALSKSTKKTNRDDGLTDSFLDSIINDQSDDNEYTVK